MGLFSFIKDAGAKLFGDKEKEAQMAEEERAAKLLAHINSFSLRTEGVTASLNGSTVVLEGEVDTLQEKNRIIADMDQVVRRNPDVILASWCGKMFKKKKLLARNNWDKIKAVEEDKIFEIDSSIILQPGPAAVSEGLEILFQIFSNWQKENA